LWALPVDKVALEHVLAILQPIWESKSVTASRLRGRIEAVLDYAKVRGLREGENPARWRGHLDKLLSKSKKLARGHHPAMPYAEVPAFVQSLRGRDGMAAIVLEFLILTAARSGEARGARWDEIDFAAKVWTVPGVRMKAGCEHRVPLSGRALAILEGLAEARIGEFVFPGQRCIRPISASALDELLQRMNIRDATPHGFRSAFRDWAGDCTHFPREICEAALAHVAGDETERAYRRGDALEKRRQLMEAWAQFCTADTGGTILKLKWPAAS
jgi:integrase